MEHFDQTSLSLYFIRFRDCLSAVLPAPEHPAHNCHCWSHLHSHPAKNALQNWPKPPHPQETPCLHHNHHRYSAHLKREVHLLLLRHEFRVQLNFWELCVSKLWSNGFCDSCAGRDAICVVVWGVDYTGGWLPCVCHCLAFRGDELAGKWPGVFVSNWKTTCLWNVLVPVLGGLVLVHCWNQLQSWLECFWKYWANYSHWLYSCSYRLCNIDFEIRINCWNCLFGRYIDGSFWCWINHPWQLNWTIWLKEFKFEWKAPVNDIKRKYR